MPTISKDNNCVTLINVFAVEPARQGQLIDLLIRATTTTVANVAGFMSASFHRSLDGTKVTVYAQWRSQKDYEAMRGGDAPQPLFFAIPGGGAHACQI